jgi:hypothetical protein
MKCEEINNRTKDAVNHLVEALESGQSEVLTQYWSTMARFHNCSFWQCDADCSAESADMLRCLAGVNEHAVLRIVGSDGA